MKKTLLSGLLLAMSGAFAVQAQVAYIPYFYSTTISPNGKYVGSGKAVAAFYNTQSEEFYFYEDGTLGLGNCISNNGIMVGDFGQNGAIFFNEGEDGSGKPEFYVPYALRQGTYSNINAITPDGTRFCGYYSVRGTKLNELPFYCDRDENGDISEVHILPYPEKDNFGSTPTRATAVWISEDGKTILGQLVSGNGFYNDPIVYTQDSNGEWTYDLPAKDLFNPTGIVLPEDPYTAEGAPKYPELQDYMDPDLYQVYLELFTAYIMYESDYRPDPVEFMTPEQVEEYNNEIEAYDAYFSSPEQREKVAAYEAAINEIQKTSSHFGLNDLALSLDGKKFLTTEINEGLDAGSNGTTQGIWLFDLENGTHTKLHSSIPNLAGRQILSDGTIVGMQPYMLSPISTYLMLPGADDFISIADYLEPIDPIKALFMSFYLPYGTGSVPLPEDKTVYMGGVVSGNFLAEPEEFVQLEMENMSYTFGNNPHEAGVSQIVEENEDGIYKVYNLQGVNVLTTEDPSQINNLVPGIYIVNGKKIAVK